MQYDHKQIASLTTNNIKQSWKFQPPSDQMNVWFKAFGEAFRKAVKASLSQATAVGVINGGSSLPAGPVEGATCVFPVGSLIVPALSLRSHYSAPTFTMKHPTRVLISTNRETQWMKIFVTTVCSEFDKAWLEWFAQWKGETKAHGGVAGWISGSPPVPGPWSGGTIVEVPIASMPSNASTSQSMLNIPKVVLTKLRFKDAFIDVPDHGTLKVKMCETPHTENIILGISEGLSKTFFDIVKEVCLVDASGASASGVANPGGVISGGSITCGLSIT